MAELDAAALAQLAIKVGLITPAQLQEAYEEIGEKTNDLNKLLNALERKDKLTPFQSAKLLKGDTDGYFLAGYRLLYKIASGSFGRVYRADDPRTGRVVALKVLRRRWSDDKQRIELFNREGRVGMSLQHPNIVEILAINQDVTTRQYFFVMEFVEGGNLREFLAIRKKVEAREALRIMDDAVQGLAHAYARGITHRDIKLTNILISTQGEAKLVDFGLAQIYANVAREVDRVERTVEYAGLEKATGVKSGDVRSDIFFLGCVLYELLTGRSPLERIRDKHARMNPRRFSDVQPMRRDEVDAPSSVFQLVETMMSLSPQRRYQTPSQLLDSIRSVRRELENTATGSKPGTGGPQSIYVVETDERLMAKIRTKFKELGFRVLIANDPIRALDRYRQQPYQGLIIDARTTGEDGLMTFDRIMAEADRHGQSLVGVLLLSDEQAGWAYRVHPRPTAAVLVDTEKRRVTLKQLHRKVMDLLGINGEED
ncbi:MAG: protein kinase [Planctomycetes bacterium]|nr:protein kinase [Planctomycetota bacterium]